MKIEVPDYTEDVLDDVAALLLRLGGLAGPAEGSGNLLWNLGNAVLDEWRRTQ